jgi:microcystin-dependent protein
LEKDRSQLPQILILTGVAENPMKSRQEQKQMNTTAKIICMVVLLGTTSCVTQKQLNSAISSVAPAPGTIIPFAGSKIPEGWLLCNGETVSRTKYPSLFNAIGTHWGGTANDEFKLPDLRRRFVRGADGSALKLGTYQNDATKMPNNPFVTDVESTPHTHQFEDAHFAETSPNDHLLGNRGKTDNDNSRKTTTQTTAPNSQSHTHPITGGDEETRPINAAINFIIKT